MKVMKVNLIHYSCLFFAITLLFACGGSEGNFKKNRVDSTYVDSVSRARMSELPIKYMKNNTKASKGGVFHVAAQRAKYTF